VILDESSLALIGNASERRLRVGEGRCPEAFSIRRLGGSRWLTGLTGTDGTFPE